MAKKKELTKKEAQKKINKKIKNLKKVKITTEGQLSGNLWDINIKGIPDELLETAEKKILKIFGRKKKKVKA